MGIDQSGTLAEVLEPNLPSLIGSAVAARMTPDFIEKEIATRVDKLIVESIDRALRSYSDTGKLIQQAIAEALRVERLDIPSYGLTVAAMLKSQIEATVAPLVAGRLAADMQELLSLAPQEVKLSSIADTMRKSHEGEAYGPVITVIVEPTEYGNTRIYLDDQSVWDDREKHRSEYRLLLGADGTIISATVRDRDIKSTTQIGRAYGLDQQIRAWFACGTKIILDEDAVLTSVGDY